VAFIPPCFPVGHGSWHNTARRRRNERNVHAHFFIQTHRCHECDNHHPPDREWRQRRLSTNPRRARVSVHRFFLTGPANTARASEHCPGQPVSVRLVALRWSHNSHFREKTKSSLLSSNRCLVVLLVLFWTTTTTRRIPELLSRSTSPPSVRSLFLCFFLHHHSRQENFINDNDTSTMDFIRSLPRDMRRRAFPWTGVRIIHSKAETDSCR
jgi:hypothetical protein